MFLFTMEQTGNFFIGQRAWLVTNPVRIHVLGIGELCVIFGGSYEFGSVC